MAEETIEDENSESGAVPQVEAQAAQIAETPKFEPFYGSDKINICIGNEEAIGLEQFLNRNASDITLGSQHNSELKNGNEDGNAETATRITAPSAENIANETKPIHIINRKKKYCVATLLLFGRDYVISASVLAHTIRSQYSADEEIPFDLACIVSYKYFMEELLIDGRKPTALLLLMLFTFDHLIITDTLSFQVCMTRWKRFDSLYERWLPLCFTKLTVLRMECYEKVLFLDADMTCHGKVHPLFALSTPAGTLTEKSKRGIGSGSPISRRLLERSLVETYGMSGACWLLTPSLEDYRKAIKKVVVACSKTKDGNYAESTHGVDETGEKKINAGPDEQLVSTLFAPCCSSKALVNKNSGAEWRNLEENKRVFTGWTNISRQYNCVPWLKHKFERSNEFPPLTCEETYRLIEKLYPLEDKASTSATAREVPKDPILYYPDKLDVADPNRKYIKAINYLSETINIGAIDETDEARNYAKELDPVAGRDEDGNPFGRKIILVHFVTEKPWKNMRDYADGKIEEKKLKIWPDIMIWYNMLEDTVRKVEELAESVLNKGEKNSFVEDLKKELPMTPPPSAVYSQEYADLEYEKQQKKRTDPFGHKFQQTQRVNRHNARQWQNNDQQQGDKAGFNNQGQGKRMQGSYTKYSNYNNRGNSWNGGQNKFL